jgi:hypothetical protein
VRRNPWWLVWAYIRVFVFDRRVWAARIRLWLNDKRLRRKVGR